MASNFYSPHYTTETPSTTLAGILPDDPAIKVASGLRHATMRHTHALIDLTSATIAAATIVRMFTMKSSDRLFQLLLSVPAAWDYTAMTWDIGLYLAGNNHDGAVVDADLFASAVDGKATIARVDQFIEAGTLEDEDRGRQLWEMANEGAATLTADPNVFYDIALTAVTVTTPVTSGEILLEAIYKSGGN